LETKVTPNRPHSSRGETGEQKNQTRRGECKKRIQNRRPNRPSSLLKKKHAHGYLGKSRNDLLRQNVGRKKGGGRARNGGRRWRVELRIRNGRGPVSNEPPLSCLNQRSRKAGRVVFRERERNRCLTKSGAISRRAQRKGEDYPSGQREKKSQNSCE